MRFLLDVNASGVVLELLLDLGHDVACVGDIDPSMGDSAILTWAVREERIIITTDSDFEQMIWLQERQHCGVLRLENLPRSQRIMLIQEVLANYAQDLEAGAVVIATQRNIRIRRRAVDN
jgi:predicted nuclease of predicted toxin-antitoxin system